MQKINFNSDWIFKLKHMHPGKTALVRDEERSVTLPHDFSIENGMSDHCPNWSNAGFFATGNAVYKKYFVAPNSWENKSVLVEFDGIFYNSAIYINDQLVERHPYGYTGFVCDLTTNLLYGEHKQNELRVEINANMMPNSRWYPGCGIYRNVHLHVGNALAIAPWDVSVTTPEINLHSYEKGDAKVEAEITVTAYPWLFNGQASLMDVLKVANLKASIKNAAGKAISTTSINIAENVIQAVDFLEKPMMAEFDDVRYCTHKVAVRVSFDVKDADLWSVEHPNLYSFECAIETPEFLTETKTTTFGIRKIEISAGEGFKLNGQVRKIKGGCVHHDCGFLGSAAYDRAEERKIELLKASGYDGLRCAHNPPSSTLLDVCDRLGMLVIDEAFDCWHQGKNEFDYGMFFEEHWQKDMASMILRDRNHPSVIMWSIGNEVNERNGKNNGHKTARALANYSRLLDPTRPVTSALCVFWDDTATQCLISQKIDEKTNNAFAWNHVERYATEEETYAETGKTYTAADVRWGEITAPYADALDVVGYNYLNWRYATDHMLWPDRILMGTETFPLKAFETWQDTLDNDCVIGDFVWTSLDYLGEAGIGHIWYKADGIDAGFMGNYPWNQAYCGDIDVCGFKRPQSYYRDCLWGVADKPYIAVYEPRRYDELDNPENDVSPWSWHDVHNSWSWPGYEGKPIRVEVYSTDDEVELFINGETCGRVACGKDTEYIATFNTTYQPGEIKAVTYKNGVAVNESVLVTPEIAKSIRLTADRAEICHIIEDGDISFVTVELIDGAGNLVSHCNDIITYSVEGAGTLLAVGSGNPTTDEGYIGNERCLFYGKGMIAIRPNVDAKAGETITVSAKNADGITGKCVITLK